jgi:hypothetical protein
VGRDIITGAARMVTLDECTLATVSVRPCDSALYGKYPKDGVLGAGAAEKLLTRLIDSKLSSR